MAIRHINYSAEVTDQKSTGLSSNVHVKYNYAHQ